MKKLLSILAAVGLTATASSAVVSCGTTTGTNDSSEVQKLKQQILDNQKTIQKNEETIKNDQKQLSQAEATLANLQKEHSDDQAEIKKIQGVIDSLNGEITSLQGQIKTANETITKLQDELKNPLTMQAVTQTKGSTDFSKFDIQIGGQNIKQGAISSDQLKNITLKSNGRDLSKITVTSASISGNVLSVTLSNPLQQEFDYMSNDGYDFQFIVGTTITDTVLSGASQFFTVPPLASASFMDDQSATMDSKAMTITMALNNSATLKAGDITNIAAYSIFVFGSDASNTPKITKGTIAINNGSATLVLTVDKMPTLTTINTNINNQPSTVTVGFWDLTLSTNQDGIQAGLSQVFNMDGTLYQSTSN